MKKPRWLKKRFRREAKKQIQQVLDQHIADMEADNQELESFFSDDDFDAGLTLRDFKLVFGGGVTSDFDVYLPLR